MLYKRCLLAAFLSVLCYYLPAQVVKQHGQLHVEGTQLTDQYNKPVVLRGMSFGWHNFHPRFYNEKAVRWLSKDWKCTVVRAAMGIELRNGYKDDSANAIARVKAVVEGAIKAGIYVIIDWHSHNINLEEAKRFFGRMAAQYGKYPNVIYEVFNEPDHETWEQVKNYSEQVIDVIRKSDPDNIILVGSPNWDQFIHLPAADPIKDRTNLMYTVHYYADTHKQELRDRTDAALKKGLPVFISESAGMSASGDGPLNDAEWKAWIDWSEARKLSWITWSVSDKNETCSVLETSAASDGGWKETDLKESGRKIRDYLRFYNKDEK